LLKRESLGQNLLAVEKSELNLKPDAADQSKQLGVNARLDESIYSEDDWEEIDSRLVAVDCAHVHVFANSLFEKGVNEPEQLGRCRGSERKNKAPSTQVFLRGNPPLVNFNQPLVDKIFDAEDCGGIGEAHRDLISLKGSTSQLTDEKAVWYNSAVEPNCGTSLFLEVDRILTDTSIIRPDLPPP